MTQRLMIRKSKFSLQKNWPWLITLIMAGILIALVVVSSGWRERKLIKHFEEELATTSEANVAAIIDQIADFGDEGIKPLVSATNSPREVVSQHARRKLNDLFATWERLPADVATKKIAILAQAFATEVEHFGPTAKNIAADFAERILLLKTDSRVISRTTLISHCDTILRSATVQDATNNQFVSQRPTHTTANHTARKTKMNIKVAESLTPLPNLPGGGIPIEPIKKPSEFGLEDDSQPELLQTPKSATPLEVDNDSTVPRPLNPNQLQPKRIPSRTDQLIQDRLDKMDEEPGFEQDTPSFAELILQIQSTDKRISTSATQRLVQLGFDQYRLAIGWEMRHPKLEAHKILLEKATHERSSVRKQLARTIARSQGMKIWPWLIWLSLDADEEVRREAIVQMGAIEHQEVVKRLQNIAEQETDHSIKTLAERILEQKKR